MSADILVSCIWPSWLLPERSFATGKASQDRRQDRRQDKKAAVEAAALCLKNPRPTVQA